MKILIIDDEIQLTLAVSEILKKNNYLVDVANDGEEGLDLGLTGLFDLIILDVMMPKLNGIEVVSKLRQNNIQTPVLMLSAKSETSDKIEGLNMGADDYLTKPFNSEELIARIKALTRRKTEFTGNVITYNDLVLDKDTMEISVNENRISLGKKEYGILEMLMSSGGKIVNKERVIEKIWGFSNDAEYNTVEVYITFIRRKLDAIKSTTEIKSVRSIGYILTSNV